MAEIKLAYRATSDCGRRLWREAFILGVAWEGNHEALRRYALSNTSVETYFVVPTYCTADNCLDHRVDWAKNAMLDAQVLMSAAFVASRSGRSQPRDWLALEEIVGNVQEILI